MFFPGVVPATMQGYKDSSLFKNDAFSICKHLCNNVIKEYSYYCTLSGTHLKIAMDLY